MIDWTDRRYDVLAREILQCTFCGYRYEREEHPGAVYCGPHRLSDGTYEPARRMRPVCPDPIED